jgi:hypothetical protein
LRGFGEGTPVVVNALPAGAGSDPSLPFIAVDVWIKKNLDSYRSLGIDFMSSNFRPEFFANNFFCH